MAPGPSRKSEPVPARKSDSEDSGEESTQEDDFNPVKVAHGIVAKVGIPSNTITGCLCLISLAFSSKIHVKKAEIPSKPNTSSKSKILQPKSMHYSRIER
jgi:hypothetical protein